ncbi:unnamed protein product [Polarella glacialis]|uniref:Uncharacterized protein n=1 Tax=Polarella glacialis TaxID=89957 RepID=A0A813FVK9_POLGL|nr:unnamed protein product [Polarella glacialis]
MKLVMSQAWNAECGTRHTTIIPTTLGHKILSQRDAKGFGLMLAVIWQGQLQNYHVKNPETKNNETASAKNSMTALIHIISTARLKNIDVCTCESHTIILSGLLG